MPAALTIHPSAAPAVDPPLGGLAEAFDNRRVETVGVDALNLDPGRVGEAGSPTRVRSMQSIDKRRACEWIDGSPSDQADALVRRLVAAGLIQ
jgi:electron transfer flavoprotein alpha/beta subunit